MKKALLSLAAFALALTANAQGITAVGANVIIVPSVQWDKQAYDAWTYVINSGTNYGDWNTDNPNYNVLCGDEPADDSNGKHWNEVGYNPEDEATIGDNMFTGEEILWETHTAPFSNDETYNGLPSYRWTDSSIMADIYFRRSFTTTSVLPNDVYLACGHDDAPCEYYINGVLVFSKDGDPAAGNGWNNNEFVKLTDEQKALIKKDGSENILAVHVHQNWGGAFADCGLYTSVPGGVDMGYVTPWTGKTIFNSWGGYNYNNSSSFRNAGAKNEWEALYEAMPGDVYTLHMTTETMDQWGAQLHFKTPINLDENKTYTLKFKLTPTCDIDQVTVKVCERDNDEVIAYDETDITLSENEAYTFEEELDAVAIENMKLVFDFAMGYKDNDVVISDLSLTDETGKELWVGTHYFNYMYFLDMEGNQVKTPRLDGRTETKAWTNVGFDDSNWDDTAMPIGNQGYMSEVQTIWPGNKDHLDYTGDGGEGNNTGFWVRRTFTLDQINPSLEYLLNVCHDDDYETYVNGHLLQQNTGWTNGKNPVQVHIKASYLNVGENVIATEIHQNWGGRFYDCGINVVEFNYQEVIENANAAIAQAKNWEGDLTEAMRTKYNELLADAEAFIATELDGAEIKNYINDTFAKEIARIQGYAGTVTAGRELIAVAKADTSDWKGELKSKVAAAEEGFEACETGDAVNNVVNPIKNARKRAHSERRANTFVGSPAAEGDYYIYNVGEQLFLGGGESWGAHAALEYASNAMTLIPAGENAFIIETYRPNGNIGENDFLGYNGYVDVSAQDIWVFVPVEGKENVYNIRRNGENGENGVLLGYRGGDNQNGYSWNVVDSDMRTPELESNQWMLITKAELDAQAEKATATAAVDMTHLISNPGFDQRLTLDFWEGHNIWGRGNNHADFVHEAWNSDCALGQQIEDDGLVEGWYTLEVQGYYRDGSKENHAAKLEAGEEPEQAAILYTDNEEIALKRIDENEAVIPYTINSTFVYNGVRCPDYPTDAAEAFEHGAYKNVLKFEVTKAGVLYFGIETTADAEGRWTVVDNFRLKYWGLEEPTDEATAITEVNAGTTAAQGIFNLAGQKLVKAAKGVNIINGKKVVIK